MQFIILVLLIGCSALEDSSSKRKEKPLWLNNPMAICSENTEICTSAEASGRMLADAAARNALAQYFQTKVKSSLNYDQTAFTNATEKTDVKENIQQSLNEETDLLLEGVEIVERYEDEMASYSLAKLNKQVASNLIKKRIYTLEGELESLEAENTRSSVRRMLEKFVTLEALNERNLLLTGYSVASDYTYARIKSLMKQKKKIQKYAFYRFNGNKKKGARSMNIFLKSILSDRNIGLVNKRAKADLIIKSNMIQKKEYLNVKGFIKMKYTVVLTSLNPSGVKLGTIQAEVSKVGRTKEDCLKKALGELRREITNKMDELYI